MNEARALGLCDKDAAKLGDMDVDVDDDDYSADVADDGECS